MINAPSTFVTFMNKVFAPHIGKHALVYLDDIIVYSPLVEQHHKDLEENVVNNSIHHVSILPLLGHFKDKSLVFAFDFQNELASTSGNMIVWFPDSAQLTCFTHACGK
ncbi:hypothetical protein DSO57_1031398 [Entomophthora muscae]|uniref:Uncharacterized protein n=1 Tax=Entomophthora muscae TaxID=34485 RepID=A0ACC2ULF4_9FUNG|nr:hypothetical protein DSO57_1031398 [Entomophthora muscae]